MLGEHAVDGGDDRLAGEGRAGHHVHLAVGDGGVLAHKLIQEGLVARNLAHKPGIGGGLGGFHGHGGHGAAVIQGHLDVHGIGEALFGHRVGPGQAGGLGGRFRGLSRGSHVLERFVNGGLHSLAADGSARHHVDVGHFAGLADELVQEGFVALHHVQEGFVILGIGAADLHARHSAAVVQGHGHAKRAADALALGLVFVFGSLDGRRLNGSCSGGGIGQRFVDGGLHGLAADGGARHHVDVGHFAGLADELVQEGFVALHHVQEGFVILGIGAADLHARHSAAVVQGHGHAKRAADALALGLVFGAGNGFGGSGSGGRFGGGSAGGLGQRVIHRGHNALAADGGAGDHVDIAFGDGAALAHELAQEVAVALHQIQIGFVVFGLGAAHLNAGHRAVVHIDPHGKRAGEALALGLVFGAGGLGGGSRRGFRDALALVPSLVDGADDALAADGRAGDGVHGRGVQAAGGADELRQEGVVVLHLAQEGGVLRGAGVAHLDAGDGGVLIHGDGHIEVAGQALALGGPGLRARGDGHVHFLGSVRQLGLIGRAIVDVEQQQVHRVVDGGGSDGGAGHLVDVAVQHQARAALAHVLAVEFFFLRTRAVAAGLVEVGVADDDIGDGAVHDLSLHVHGAAEALLAGGVAVAAQLLHQHHGLLELDARLFGDILGGVVHAAHHGAGGDGGRGDGVHLAAVLDQIHGINHARELLIEGGLLRLGAQAGGLAEIGAAHADARDGALVVHAHGDFHRAAKARHRAHGNIAHGRAVGIQALIHFGFILRRQQLEISRRGQQFLAHGHGLFGLLGGNAVLGAVVRRAEGQGGHQRDDGQHDPCGQFLTHCIFLQAIPLPFGKEGD